MKKIIDTEQFKFYMLIGFFYLLFWLLIDFVTNFDTFLQRIVNNVWLIGYLVVVNFIFFEYTIPFIKLAWKRLLVMPLLLFAQLMLYSFGLFAWRFIGIEAGTYFALKTFATIESGVAYLFPYSVFSIFIFGIAKYTHDYRKLKMAAQQLRIEKQEAELNYLKSQMNPHFLFNTLNNIYSLAKDKSDLAPESILHLSKILRFMLYETGDEYIAIEQELKIIGDYIELEKLRYDDSLRVNFNYDIEDMKQALPPLLLIPLVENAFKHGVSEAGDHPFVDIHLSVNKRQLAFVVKNSAVESPAENSVKENIGLTNLRRQLELLYKDYDLSVRQEGSVFTAVLKINLASHV
jgi:two-component system LytT family sensor kinase